MIHYVEYISGMNKENRKYIFCWILLNPYRKLGPLLQNLIAHQMQANWCLCAATTRAAFTLHQCSCTSWHPSSGSPTGICWGLTCSIHKSSSFHHWNSGLRPGTLPTPCWEWHRNICGSHCAPCEPWVEWNPYFLTTVEAACINQFKGNNTKLCLKHSRVCQSCRFIKKQMFYEIHSSICYNIGDSLRTLTGTDFKL